MEGLPENLILFNVLYGLFALFAFQMMYFGNTGDTQLRLKSVLIENTNGRFIKNHYDFNRFALFRVISKRFGYDSLQKPVYLNIQFIAIGLINFLNLPYLGLSKYR